MKIGCSFFVLLWTMVAITLTLCRVGTFADWPVTAWPWHWSCLCILYWDIAITIALLAVIALAKWYVEYRKQKVIKSYAPELQELIRRRKNR